MNQNYINHIAMVLDELLASLGEVRDLVVGHSVDGDARLLVSRATGTRGTKNLFNLAAPTKAAVAKLPSLHFGQYRLADVPAEGQIAPFVEKLTGRAYRLGEAYYQLTKPEKVQPGKTIALMDRKTKHVMTGPEVRKFLKLPDYEVKVAPANFPDFDIFVQSTSTNRKLVPGTKLLIIS